MATTTDIVAKLWGLCNILRDDGVTYNEYVTELTYLLFLKMLQETGREERLPKQYRWADLAKREGLDQLDHYKRLLLELGQSTIKDGLVKAIFTDAQTRLRKPTNLKTLTSSIDQLDWFSAREEGLGNLYEGLLEKNASDKKSGAGQYFTPRPLIDCIVRLMKPQPGEVVQDPAAGTGGFLVAADHYIKQQTDDLYKLGEQQAFFQRHSAFIGAELVPDTHRLCLMNLLLHGIEGGVELADTLSPDGERLSKANLVLTNPPFGTKKGGARPTRTDFSVTAESSNKQLAFIEHIVRSLKPGGRAAVVLPDNVLSEESAGRRVRAWMMDLCNLHTVLRLPAGIFYAVGAKTNVLFFQRGSSDSKNTNAVWIYDMRINMPAFGKTRPLVVEDFNDFEGAYGADPNGKSKRQDQGREGRWRCFSRQEIAENGDRLDLSWLRGSEIETEENLTQPDEIALAVADHMKGALSEIETVIAEMAYSDQQKRPPSPPQLKQGDVPEGWTKTTLGALVLLNPKHGQEVGDSELVSFVPMAAVSERSGRIESKQTRSFADVRKGYTHFKEGDVIFAKITPCMENGKIAVARDLMNGVACGSTEFHVLRCANGVVPELLWYFLRQKTFREDAEQSMTGAVGQRRVPTDYLRQTEFQLPPTSEQKRIVAKLASLLSKIDTARAHISRLAQADQTPKLLDRLEQAILAKAFRGELVPQDSNEETADVLLQRIRSERDAVIENTGKRPYRGRKIVDRSRTPRDEVTA